MNSHCRYYTNNTPIDNLNKIGLYWIFCDKMHHILVDNVIENATFFAKSECMKERTFKKIPDKKKKQREFLYKGISFCNQGSPPAGH